MGEIIARTSCPICGEGNQDVKINKNGNLYMYCDNRCSIRFNPKESREALELLRAGRVAKTKNMLLVPIYAKIRTEEEQILQKNAKNEQKTLKNNISEVKNDGQTASYGRNLFNGRADGEHSGTGAAAKPAGGFLSWLLDDDSDDD